MFNFKNTVTSQVCIYIFRTWDYWRNVLPVDLEMAIPSTIQMYEKVQNKRQLNSVTWSSVQRFSKHFRSVGNGKGFGFLFNKWKCIVVKCILNSSGFEITIEHPHTDVVKCTQLVRGQWLLTASVSSFLHF